MRLNFKKIAKTHDDLGVSLPVKGEMKHNCTMGELVYDALMYPAVKFDESLNPQGKRSAYDLAIRIKMFPEDLIVTKAEIDMIRVACCWKFIPIIAGMICAFLQEVDANDQTPNNDVVCSEVHS